MDASLALLLTGAMASGVAIISPIILNLLHQRDRRQERAIDFARQDAVAKRTQEVAAKLLAAQQVTIAKTDEVAVAAKLSSAITATQLKQIHILVNSDMTAARQGQLDQTRQTLILLKKIVTMAGEIGRPPSTDELLEIDETEKRIASLEAILADRLQQLKLVEAEQAAEKKALRDG